MSTHGKQAVPSRDEVIKLSTYHAAVENFFDTSPTMQQTELLTTSVIDMAPYRALPEGATHQFYVMINRTGSMVTRYADNRYEVTPHDQTEEQVKERKLRTAVLDYALWHMTGEGAGYNPNQGAEARAATIQKLLERGPENEEEGSAAADLVNHPVVRDELPDIILLPAPGQEGGPDPEMLRQWSVQVGGPWNYCEVVFFGYDVHDGSPTLVALDMELRSEDEDDEEGASKEP